MTENASARNRHRASAEHINVRPPCIDSVPFSARDFVKHAGCAERIDRLLSCWFCRGQQFTGSCQSNNRILRKKFEQAKGIDCCRFVLNSFQAIFSNDRKQTLSRRDAVVCRLNDTPQEELDPAFPVTMCTDSTQPFIVLLLVTFETEADIQQRRRKESPLFDEQCNQQTTYHVLTESSHSCFSVTLNVS